METHKIGNSEKMEIDGTDMESDIQKIRGSLKSEKSLKPARLSDS